ncbi:MAG: hypothetical protein J6Z01_15150 [Bacteroidales bacterium]|nr:hypothetical protein [Bacteroidales bacterium]
MKIAKYKSAKSTYNLPAVYLIDKTGSSDKTQYFSVNKPQKYGMTYKVRGYIPAEETSKTVELNELDKVPIIKELKPLSLKVGDVYEAQVANNKKMKFTVVSVNDDTNELQLKVEAQGKNTTVTNEWSITDFTALYYQLGEENFTITRKAETNNKKYLVIGGIALAAIGLIVLIKKASS